MANIFQYTQQQSLRSLLIEARCRAFLMGSNPYSFHVSPVADLFFKKLVALDHLAVDDYS